MRAIWEEARRAFRMTFVDGLAAVRLGQRFHAGWWSDRHLRMGYFAGLPIFLVAAFLTFQGFVGDRSFSTFFLVMLPAAILCNLVWFAVAARSRAKSGV